MSPLTEQMPSNREELIRHLSEALDWPIEKAASMVDSLRKTGKWGLDQIFYGFRAEFKCEYCDLDFLLSVDTYKLWQNDHIDRTGGDGPDNIALACLVCNQKLKNRWSPAEWKPTRSERVKQVRGQLDAQRTRLESELRAHREAIRRS